MTMQKYICTFCGTRFEARRTGRERWQDARYCSRLCCGRSWRRDNAEWIKLKRQRAEKLVIEIAT